MGIKIKRSKKSAGKSGKSGNGKVSTKVSTKLMERKAVEQYIAKHGGKFAQCKDDVKKNAYVTRINRKGKPVGWRVRCLVHHRVSCKKIMRRLRKAA